MHTGPGVSSANQQQGLASPGLLLDLAQGLKMRAPREIRCLPTVPSSVPSKCKSFKPHSGLKRPSSPSGVWTTHHLGQSRPQMLNKAEVPEASSLGRGRVASSRGQLPAQLCTPGLGTHSILQRASLTVHRILSVSANAAATSQVGG